MSKLKIVFKQVGFIDANEDFKECILKKVEFNPKKQSYKFVIEASHPINPDAFLKLQEKFLAFSKNYQLKLNILNTNHQKAFLIYWNKLFAKTFIGQQLISIKAKPEISNKVVTIYFNLSSQVDTYQKWKKEIEKKLSEIGYQVQVLFKHQTNSLLYTQKVRRETKKIHDNKLRNMLAKATLPQNSDSLTKSKTNIAQALQNSNKNLEIIVKITSIQSQLILEKSLIIYKLVLFDESKVIFGKFFYSISKVVDDPFDKIKINSWVKIKGRIDYDRYEKEQIIIVKQISLVKNNFQKNDNAKQKRVELSTHTKMSSFDGSFTAKEIIEHAFQLGHKGVAICDQDTVQAFPEIAKIAKEIKKLNPSFKVVYGSIFNVVNTHLNLISNTKDYRSIDDVSYVVLDIETTGLSACYDEIIEFAATKIQNNVIVANEHFFIKTNKVIAPKIQKLTNITSKILQDKGIEPNQAAQKIFNFINDSVLVAHNAFFDISFIENLFLKHHLGEIKNSWIDTLHLSWVLTLPKRSYKLKKIAIELGIIFDTNLTHRADYDTNILTNIFFKFLNQIKKNPQLKTLADLQKLATSSFIAKQFGYNVNIYVKNQSGLKDLYKLVSKAYTKYISPTKQVAITKKYINDHRQNLFIASGANNSEIMDLALNHNQLDLERAIDYYDFIIVNAPQNYQYLVDNGEITSLSIIKEAITKIIETAKKHNKMVVASADVFYLNYEQKNYREIFIETKRLGGKPHPLKSFSEKKITFPNKYFKTTNELLKDFAFLSSKIQNQIVVRNPNVILEQISSNVEPLKKGLFVPKITDSKQKLHDLCYQNAYQKYGRPLPKIVEARLKKEMQAIITHDFDSIYYISHLIVKKSLDNGYLVGSRGSVGSSLVATLTNITEVNPLPPHYICDCGYSDFNVSSQIKSGFDLPPKNCSFCQKTMYGDGHDIPFETFLGFKGDKIPDIDLNFSSEYQNKAHDHVKKLFGEKNVFRAGTISKIQEKIAFGYVKNYQELTNKPEMSKAEIYYLITRIVGTKRTTGQHPGGIMILPHEFDITDFTPINYPANDKKEWITTHFDYHSIHNNLLKIDLLGHVDPTAIKMMQDITKVDPRKITFYDPKVMALFSNQTTINLQRDLPLKETTGCIGIPEFGTSFVRKMLQETQPKTFNDLIILSGLSHGTGVYRGNSRELIIKQNKKMSEVIGCRDDIMKFLINKGLSNKDAFDIMEFIRKGLVSKDYKTWEKMVDKMVAHGIEQWWINSSSKITYLFPKAHAIAYVMMAWRVAWFKVYYPLHYYATLFTLRCDVFDIKTILKGESFVVEKYHELDETFRSNKSSLSNKDLELLKTLEMVIEMIARGYSFSNISLEKSKAKEFLVDEKNQQIIPPFIVVDGIGDTVANSIVNKREENMFSSISDLSNRTSLNKNSIDILEKLNVLKSLPNDDQISLFDL